MKGYRGLVGGRGSGRARAARRRDRQRRVRFARGLETEDEGLARRQRRLPGRAGEPQAAVAHRRRRRAPEIGDLEPGVQQQRPVEWRGAVVGDGELGDEAAVPVLLNRVDDLERLDPVRLRIRHLFDFLDDDRRARRCGATGVDTTVNAGRRVANGRRDPPAGRDQRCGYIASRTVERAKRASSERVSRQSSRKKRSAA